MICTAETQRIVSRMAALRAELFALFNALDKEICVDTWCSEVDVFSVIDEQYANRFDGLNIHEVVDILSQVPATSGKVEAPRCH